MADGIFVATATFITSLGGSRVHVEKGTTVREGHPLLAGREKNFQELVVDYEFTEPDKGKHSAKADAPAAPKVELKLGGS